SYSEGKIDPLFHPVEAGICSINAELAQNAVLGRVGGDFESILDAYREPLTKMQSVLGCCPAKQCEAAANSATCTLTDMPSGFEPDKNGIKLKGPVAIGSTMAEIFLLEFAEGLPVNQVAWGDAVSPMALGAMLPLHTLEFDLMERSPYLAARQGSNLAKAIVDALITDTDRVPGKSSKLVVFVGHDTNIANIGGLLGLDWALPTYQPNQTP